MLVFAKFVEVTTKCLCYLFKCWVVAVSEHAELPGKAAVGVCRVGLKCLWVVRASSGDDIVTSTNNGPTA